MAGRKHFHFSGILHAAPGADSTPSLIVESRNAQTITAVFTVKNLSDFPVTFRFIKSAGGGIDFSNDIPARNAWVAQQGPYTIAKGGELSFDVTAQQARRLALSVNALAANRRVSLSVYGHSYQDVNSYQGVVDGVSEGPVGAYNGIPNHDFSQLSYYGATNNLQYARYYLGADQVVVSGSATAAANGTYTRRGVLNGKSYYTLVGAADDVNNSAISWNGSTWTLYNLAGSGIATSTSENPWDSGWTNSVVGVGPEFLGAFEYLYAGGGAADNDKLTQVRRL